MARTAAELAAKLGRIAPEIEAATPTAVAQAAKAVEIAVAAASGPYVGKPIARVRTTLARAAGNATALVRMTSRKAHLLDHDTKPHDITARNATVMSLGPPGRDTPVAAVVHHPGTHGKFMWEKGVAVAIPEAQRIVGASLAKAVTKAMGQ